MMTHGLNLDLRGGTGEPWKGDRHGESSSVCGGCAHRGRQEALACSGSGVTRAHLKRWERDEGPRETQEVLQSPSQSSLWGGRRERSWSSGVCGLAGGEITGTPSCNEQNWAVRRGSRSGPFVPGFPPFCLPRIEAGGKPTLWKGPAPGNSQCGSWP